MLKNNYFKLILFSSLFIILYNNLFNYISLIFLIPLFFYLKEEKKFPSKILIPSFILIGIISFSYFYGYGIKFMIIVGILMSLFYLPFSYISFKLLKTKYYIIGIPISYFLLYKLFNLFPTSNFWLDISGFLQNMPLIISYLGTSITNIIIVFINILLFYFIDKYLTYNKLKKNNLKTINKKGKNKKINNKIILNFSLLIILIIIILIPIQNKNYNNFETLKVVGIQGNIDQDWYERSQLSRTNLFKYINLSNKALNENSNIDIIIWPEYVFTHLIELDFQLINYLKNYSNSNNITLIIGSILLDDLNSNNSKRYNTLYIFDQNNLSYYNAYEPVLIFDEHAKKAKKNEKIIIKNTSLGLTLCFEENFPYIFNQYATQKNAQMYFVIGNQYYIKNSKGLELTSIASKLRAVETQKFVFRLETSGLSAIFSPQGKILKNIPINTDNYLIYEIPKISENSFYSNYYKHIENLFLIFSIIIFLIIYFKIIKNNKY